MSVRHSLLAILTSGACYGYQLRAELERRTGGAWTVNVGQIYNTLERLERDGLVAKGDVDAQGHVYYAVTDAGRATADAWLRLPVARPAATRDELTVKLAMAATLPGPDAAATVAAEQEAARLRLDALEAIDTSDALTPEDLTAAISHDATLEHARAEVVWLDRTAERIARMAAADRILPLSAARPKRGRPRVA
ncbi:PadR family transcriptional regulator [Microbacterium sp. NPDC089189]|uniref:PadR family transcriptional regulator n=1 Tax=Microbacterium sp. NPDC089189 TaxID=3154972 RepID=UPI00342BEB55